MRATVRANATYDFVLGAECERLRSPIDYTFKVARDVRQRSGFWQLRKQIFCEEQQLFRETDRDEIDAAMIPIVCQTLVMGSRDEVVGCVRIDEREPGVWWGGRLGVAPAFRHLRQASPAVADREKSPRDGSRLSVGAGLIFEAVTTARRRGCVAFYAHVQLQNVRLFEKLGWTPLEEQRMHGIVHATMRADLDRYPLLWHGSRAAAHG